MFGSIFLIFAFLPSQVFFIPHSSSIALLWFVRRQCIYGQCMQCMPMNVVLIKTTKGLIDIYIYKKNKQTLWHPGWSHRCVLLWGVLELTRELLRFQTLVARWAGRGLLLPRARAVSCSLARHKRFTAAASSLGRRASSPPAAAGPSPADGSPTSVAAAAASTTSLGRLRSTAFMSLLLSSSLWGRRVRSMAASVMATRGGSCARGEIEKRARARARKRQSPTWRARTTGQFSRGPCGGELVSCGELK